MLNLGSTVIQSLASHINNLVSDTIDQFGIVPQLLLTIKVANSLGKQYLLQYKANPSR